MDDRSQSTPVSLRTVFKMLFKGPGNISSSSDDCEASEGFLAIGGGNVEEGLPLLEKFVMAMYHQSNMYCALHFFKTSVTLERSEIRQKS